MSKAIASGSEQPNDVLKMTREDVAAMTDAAFTDLFYSLLGIGTLAIVAAVHLMRLRRDSGKDVPQLQGIWQTYLPLVESGAVLPETLVTLQGSAAAVINAVASLPTAEQRRLVIDGEPVEVYELDRDGKPTPRRVPVRAMMAAHARLAFGKRTIRDATEQIAILKAPVQPKQRGASVTLGRVIVDRRSRTVRIKGGGGVVSLDEMLKAISAAGLSI